MITHRSETWFRIDGRFCRLLLVPVLITLLGFALNLYKVDSKSLWYDEFGTLTLAGLDGSWLDALVNPLTVPTLPKPPIWFFVTRIFLSLGQNDFSVRLPSVLIATLTIPLVYALGKTMFDRHVGMLAAFLMAIGPLHIRYAQEARMYAMLSFLSILSLYLFWRAVRTDEPRWWLGFFAASMLNLYVHQFAFLPLGVLTLFALWLSLRFRGRPPFPFRFRHFLLALAAILLFYAPMAPFLVEGLMSEEGLGGSTTQVYGELRWSLASLQSAFRLFSAGRNLGLVVYGFLFLLPIAILGFRELDSFRPASSSRPDHVDNIGWRPYTPYAVALNIIWIVLPVVTVLSVPTGHGVRIRYLIFVLPVYLLLVALGLRVAFLWLLARLGGRRGAQVASPAVVVVLTLMLLGALGGISAPAISEYYAEAKQNWRDATWWVQSSAAAGEMVYVTRAHHRTGVLFYARQWTGGQNLLTGDVVQLLPRDIDEGLLPPDSDRAWLIVPVGEEYPPDVEYSAALKPQYQPLTPTIFDPTTIPQDNLLMAPISYRSLAVLPIVRYKPPSISLWADDDTVLRGECTWLRWETENVRAVYLQDEGVVGNDKRWVCPTTTTTYELEAVLSDHSTAHETTEITVSEP